MQKDRLNLLKDYIKADVGPLLVEDFKTDLFKNNVVIKNNIDRSELNGHYEETLFCPPLWYKELVEKSKIGGVALIIENINEIIDKEQKKFIELLKYKKVSTFKLPKNCVIIVTCKNLKRNKLNEEVYSLLAQI